MNKRFMYKGKKWISLAVTLAMSLSAVGIVPESKLTNQSVVVVKAETICPTYQKAYDTMVALQEKYPEGMTWTNFEPYGSRGELGSDYKWKGGKVKGVSRGVGCAAFVFLLSDAAFGDLPARAVDNGSFAYDDIKVGDILRMDDSHFVIVLKKSDVGVIVAEANYNKSVHWGRAISKTEVMKANFIVTRYPANYVPEDDPSVNEIVQSGTEGNLKWALSKGGTLTISGNGAMKDYDTATASPWKAYGEDINTIMIENGVTSIGACAFMESKALSVYIPDSVTSIGQKAFYKTGIVGVTVPGSVETIGNDAFYGCENLTSATVSKGVKSIGERAFYGCTSLAYIDFPSSILSVGAGAFMSCKSITRVRFMPGTGTVAIGDNLFSQCWGLTEVTLPQTSERISAGMFQSCSSLPELYIPATVTEIGENPFTSCRGLKTIYFGGSKEDWGKLETPPLKYSLQSTGTVVQFDAEFKNPFAAEPDDPGDLIIEEDPIEPAPTVHEHNWLTKWSYNTTHHWHECAVQDCPATDNSGKDGYGEHSYGDWVIDTAATASQNGSKHRTCICSYIQTESIPATGGSTTVSPGGITGGNGNSKPEQGGSGTTTVPSNPNGSGSNSGTGSNAGSGGNSGSTSGSSNTSGTSSNTGSSNNTGTSGNAGNSVPTTPETSDSSNNKTDITDSSNGTVNDSNGNISSDNNSAADKNPSVGEDKKPSADTTVTDDTGKSVTKKQKKQLKSRFNKLLTKQLNEKFDKLLEKQLKKQQSKKKIKKQLKQELKKRLRKQLKTEFKEQLGSNFEKQLNKLFDDQFDKKFNNWFKKQYKKQNKK